MYNNEVSDKTIIQVLEEVGLKDKSVISERYYLYTNWRRWRNAIWWPNETNRVVSVISDESDLVIFDEPAIGLDIETERTIKM